MGKVQPKRTRRNRIKNYMRKERKARRHHTYNRKDRLILRGRNLVILANDRNEEEQEIRNFMTGEDNA